MFKPVKERRVFIATLVLRGTVRVAERRASPTERDFELGETKIPNKYKELIGLAVSGATRCRYCALFHTEAARLNGATDEEIAEAAMMAGYTMAGSTFLNAAQIDYDAFKEESLDIVAYVRKQQARQSRREGRAATG